MGITGRVFDIQRYSIHDGPGIRTLVFMKGCPLRCKWCSNPEGLIAAKQVMFTPRLCYGCGRCAPVCESKAITIQDGALTWDSSKCTNCLKCTEVCRIVHARKVCGQDYTVPELIEEVMKDESYFRKESGGGLTVGGGEPMNQADFVRELMKAAHKRGINTALESSSYATEENAKKVYEETDHIFTDIKHMDEEMHKKYTGVSNRPILQNIANAADIVRGTDRHLVIRIPIIPNVNDSEENIKKTAEFVASLQAADRIEILPYHNLGEAKYSRVSTAGQYQMSGIRMLEKYELEPLKKIIEAYEIPCNIGGL